MGHDRTRRRVKMSRSRVRAARETHGVLSRLFGDTTKFEGREGVLRTNMTAGSFVDAGVGLAPLRVTNRTAEALFCKKVVDTRGRF